MLAQSSRQTRDQSAQRVVMSLSDKSSFVERLDEMQVPLTENQLKRFTERKNAIDLCLKDIDLQVNNN